MVNARGYLFISLNAVRFLSIISLILLFASSIVTMAADIKAVNAFMAAGKSATSSGNSTAVLDCSVYDCDYVDGSTVPNQPAGAFWAVLNRLLIIFQSVVLILSECSWPSKFFENYFPVLGPNFGLGALGVIQCLLGAAVLSHHVDKFALVSAFLVFSVGCLNIFLGLIFRERAKKHRSFKEHKESKQGVLPTSIPPFGMAEAHESPVRNMFTGSSGYGYSNEKGATGVWKSTSVSSPKAGLGFGRQGSKLAANQGFVVRQPEEAVPPYAAKPSLHSRSGSASSYVKATSASTPSRYSASEDHNDHDREDDDRAHGHAVAPAMTRSSSEATAV